ncbi:MAG TPA: GSCFA domain-containing protein [Falsiroseomonas sp.]|nr:GSCFA domain-containing protein [Falsiroseomonas sp.]
MLFPLVGRAAPGVQAPPPIPPAEAEAAQEPRHKAAALGRHKYRHWNRSPSTAQRSKHPEDAANRIFEGCYIPQELRGDLRLRRGDEIFTMGSCFAREIEHALRQHGHTITSIAPELMADPGIWGSDSRAKLGFFHRYNLLSMEQEIGRALGTLAFREDADLLGKVGDGVFDMNYTPSLPRLDVAGAQVRRVAVRRMVASVRTAKLIVLTLGLTEAWVHKPTGLFCNALIGEVLGPNRGEFEFAVTGFTENLRALEHIYKAIYDHHATRDFSMVLTVSPVPLQTGFSQDDIVIASTRSKSTLRAVADEFCQEHSNAIYFPSYEMAMYSDRDVVWRPDRVHINADFVSTITQTFIDRYAG